MRLIPAEEGGDGFARGRAPKQRGHGYTGDGKALGFGAGVSSKIPQIDAAGLPMADSLGRFGTARNTNGRRECELRRGVVCLAGDGILR